MRKAEMATRSYSCSPLRDSVVSGRPTLNAPIAVRLSEEARPEASTGAMVMNWEARTKKLSPTRSIWPTSPPHPGEHASRLCRSRQRGGQYGTTNGGWSKGIIAPTPTCTPTSTPLQTPTLTPSKEVVGFTAQSASPYARLSMPTRPVGTVEAHQTHPKPMFFPRDPPSVTAGSRSVGADQANRGSAGIKNKDDHGIWDVNAPARPLEGQARSSVANGVEASETETRKQVDQMFDESTGILRLVRSGLGDYRVPFLTLQRLRDAYRSGAGSLRAWTTSNSTESGQRELIEVQKESLGVLYSSHAFVFHFSIHSTNEKEKFDLAYIWLGRQADIRARTAARNQAKKLLEHLPRSSSQVLPPPTPLEVEQGYEPALFLGLFSYMVPPLVAVVHQTRQETPDVRVFEIQESPCFKGSGIALAVEGDPSLLAEYGPLPSRSYIVLVRPHLLRVGKRGKNGLIGAFDEGFYWHGLEETAAVQATGVLLCQQGQRMFPPSTAAERGRRKRKVEPGEKKRRGGGAFGECRMMRGFISDLKIGWPIPDGFWACILPEASRKSIGSVFSAEDQRRLLPQDLKPSCRSRPVRIFSVCDDRRKAGHSFVWEVMTGGFPSHMGLSPYMTHIVDAGGSHVYVWTGADSHHKDRRSFVIARRVRLALRVAQSYADRVEGGPTVEQANAGSEPNRLLECFPGWEKARLEMPRNSSKSPCRVRTLRAPSAIETPPQLTPTTKTTPYREGLWSIEVARAGTWDHRGRHLGRSGGSIASSGSSSTASRLTPPGQRTPPWMVNSPPPLKSLGGNGLSPCNLYRAASSTPPRSSVTPPRSSVTPLRASTTLPPSSVTLPRSSVTPPLASVTLPRASVTPPRASVTLPRSSVTPPLASVTLPRASVTPPRSSVTLPRASVTPPRASVTLPRASVIPPRRLQQLPVRETGEHSYSLASDIFSKGAKKNSVNEKNLRYSNLSPKGLDATPASATGSDFSTAKFRCAGLTSPDRTPTTAKSRSRLPVDTEMHIGESRKLFLCPDSKEPGKTAAVEPPPIEPCNGDAVGSDPIGSREEPEETLDTGRGCSRDDSKLHGGDQSGVESSKGGDMKGTKEEGIGAHPWVGLNEDGSWQSEGERRAAGKAGAEEAERRRLAKINGDDSWRAKRGKEGEELQGARHVRRDSDSLNCLQKGNVRDKLSMFEGVSSPTPMKERQGEDRSSLGALHDRGLVRSMNKKLTSDTKPAPPPIVVNSTHEVDNGSTYHGGDYRPFSSPPRFGKKLEKDKQSPGTLRDPEQRRRELVWWKQRSSPSPPSHKSRPSLELIRDGQVRIMSEQLLMSCPDGSERSNQEAATNVPSTPPPRITGRLRWGGTNQRWGVSSATTSPTKRNNFWLGKTGLGGKQQGDCPASAPATPTRNRKGVWWRGRTMLTSSPSTTPLSGKTKNAVEGTLGSKEQRMEDSRQANATWVKIRRRPIKEG